MQISLHYSNELFIHIIERTRFDCYAPERHSWQLNLAPMQCSTWMIQVSSRRLPAPYNFSLTKDKQEIPIALIHEERFVHRDPTSNSLPSLVGVLANVHKRPSYAGQAYGHLDAIPATCLCFATPHGQFHFEL